VGIYYKGIIMNSLLITLSILLVLAISCGDLDKTKLSHIKPNASKKVNACNLIVDDYISVHNVIATCSEVTKKKQGVAKKEIKTINVCLAEVKYGDSKEIEFVLAGTINQKNIFQSSYTDIISNENRLSFKAGSAKNQIRWSIDFHKRKNELTYLLQEYSYEYFWQKYTSDPESRIYSTKYKSVFACN